MENKILATMSDKLNLYSTLIRKKNEYEYKMMQELQKTKLKYKIHGEEIKDSLLLLEKELKKLATKNKDALFTEGKRSVDFEGISIGFRKSTEIIIPTDKKEEIISLLEFERAFDCLDIKKTIKKTAISQFDDSRLEELGIKRNYKDNFYIECKDESL